MRRIGAVLLWAGCALASSSDRELERRPPVALPLTPLASVGSLVLVTIDGVRWQEVFGGVEPELAHRAGLPAAQVRPSRELLPNLYRRLIDRGVALGAGVPLLASGPNFVSLPGYREILTGRADRDCTDNECPPVDSATLLDQMRAELALPLDQVAAIASWEVIARAAARAPDQIALSAGRHGGPTRARFRVSENAAQILDRGAVADPWPGQFDYRPDRYTAALALAYVAARSPRFLYVGLGDTDELAHRGDYRGYLRGLADCDSFLGALLDRLPQGAVVVVTADHGRSVDFRSHGRDRGSARVWLVAAGGPVPARGIVTSGEAHRLRDIAPTLRPLLGLAPDRAQQAGTPIPELLSPLLFATRQ